MGTGVRNACIRSKAAKGPRRAKGPAGAQTSCRTRSQGTEGRQAGDRVASVCPEGPSKIVSLAGGSPVEPSIGLRLGPAQLPIKATLPGPVAWEEGAGERSPTPGGETRSCDPGFQAPVPCLGPAAESHEFSSQDPRAVRWACGEGPVGLTRPRNHCAAHLQAPSPALRGWVCRPAAPPWPFLSRVWPMLH